jgi:signal transduction histidine kinase
MDSPAPRRQPATRLVSVRLTAWYCGLFSLSLAVLFGFVYATLDATLRKANAEFLHSKVKEFADTYRNAGIPEIMRDASQKRSDELLVRVSDARNRTLFASLPYSDPLGPQALQALEARSILPTERFFKVSLGKWGTFEFANTRLKNGSLLQIGRNAGKRRILLEHFVASCLAVTFPVLLLALGGGALMADRALRPLRKLTATVQNIVTTGSLDARISPEETAGELRELVVSFDRMLEKIQALVEGMRGVLDNVAHDLRTPITRLRGVAELALRNPDLAGSQEALADCVEESERVITMLNTLMDISEVETGAMKLNLERVDVTELARQLTDFYAEVAEDRGLKISLSAPNRCETVADENRLRQAVANLLDNAVKYTPEGGRVEVSVKQMAGRVVLGVRDTGIGIPKEDLPRVWERLYRGDKSRSQRGLGLGLSLVKAIAQAHHGDCRVSSEPGSGSEFILRIPMVRGGANSKFENRKSRDFAHQGRASGVD